MPSKPPIADGRQSMRVYRTLRERIIRGEYEQGAHLAEARIGEELQVSRVPLRDAVPLLERDGLVERIPGAGARVVRWTAAAVDELCDLRAALDAFAAERAARRVAAGASDLAIENARAHSARVRRTSTDGYVVASALVAFHEAVGEVAGNRLLLTTLSTLTARIVWLRCLDPSAGTVSQAEHDRIHTLIRAGDVAAAAAAAREHVEHDRALALAIVAAGEVGSIPSGS